MQRGLLVCAVLLATVAEAEEKDASPETEERRTFVGLVPISLGSGLVAIDGEHAVGKRLSIRTGLRVGTAFVRTQGAAGNPVGSTSNASVGLEPGIRYYVTGTALDGMWIGPHLELSYAQFNTSSVLSSLGSPGTVDVEASGQNWRAGAAALVGYSMVVARGLTVQAGVGLGGAYTSERTTMEDTLNPEQPTAVVFRSKRWEFAERATLAVGWSF
ncbi:DUF3575 domain-containing protein [Hyalangium minutum]|uniref:Outer membrane protein beta-barrel domain-containing protein n=1 Tax=Hyalangium minutum TaxID=394096 RepID=A0A085WEE7_9BACT|nr:DUF3575 domain-containing protein [Hyalangium minutum]KFE66060.1 hypothetical protein DB31_1125 [Hyalangium minutum]